MTPPYLWSYRGRAERVVDADTGEAWIATGFHAYRRDRLRILRVNAPETNSRDPAVREAARVATAFTAARLAEYAAQRHTESPD